jgi:hypothetical protein
VERDLRWRHAHLLPRVRAPGAPHGGCGAPTAVLRRTVQGAARQAARAARARELLTEWQAAKKSQGLRASTLAQYRNVVDKWLMPHVGGFQLSKMSPAQAQQLVELLRSRGGRNDTPLSDRSVQLSIVVLKAATAWAFETGLVGRDPLAGFRRPRAQAGKGADEAWAAENARAFLASVASDRLVAAWTLLLTRGLRRGELAGCVGMPSTSIAVLFGSFGRGYLWTGNQSTLNPRRTRAGGRSPSTRLSSHASALTGCGRVSSGWRWVRRGPMTATYSRTSSAHHFTQTTSRIALRR